MNNIRSAEKPIPVKRKIVNTIAILCMGIALGVFSNLGINCTVYLCLQQFFCQSRC